MVTNQIKKTLAVLLAVLCVATMTVTVVSADDVGWSQTVSVDKPTVDSDINGLTEGVDFNAVTTPENWQKIYTNFKTYSIALMTDSQKALDHSQAETVSSGLISAKAAYEKALGDANWAGFYANKYVTDTAGGKGEDAMTDLKNTVICINAYKTDINEASRLYDIYLKSQA
jgi:hypothetical protein